MPQIYVNNLTIHTGTDFTVTFVLEDALSNSLKNLTGYTGCAQMRRYETSQKTADFTTNFATDRTTGRVSIAMGSTSTATLKAGKYFYDLVLQDSSGIKDRIIEGTILVKKSVTR